VTLPGAPGSRAPPTPAMAKLHIVIPDFNGWEQTRVCLEALRLSTYTDMEVIVVDHGTTETTRQGLSSDYPAALHVRGESALWWTGATNLGIRKAMERDAATIMLLNNDCYVRLHTIERLMDHHQRAPHSIIAPVQSDALTKRVLCATATSCYFLGLPIVIAPWGAERKLRRCGLLPTKLIVGGRGVVIPAEMFHRVGLLDEKGLPHYGSDNDFYMRCRRAGIPLYIAPNAVVEIDRRTTTQAVNLGCMSFRKFLDTLRDRRSHRNLRDLTALFKRHYPIKGLHHFGVMLNLLRYFLLFGWERLRGAFKAG